MMSNIKTTLYFGFEMLVGFSVRLIHQETVDES